jgi:hypothetical protein
MAQMQAAMAAACKRNLHGALEWLDLLTDKVSLKTLALHNLVMPPQHTLLLRSVLLSLSDSLVELHLDLCAATGPTTVPSCTVGSDSAALEGWDFSCGIKKFRVFESIACLTQLRRLTFPHWEEFVGKDTDAPEPLTRLNALESVRVRHIPRVVGRGWPWEFVAMV